VPVVKFLSRDARFFVECLPIVGLQLLLSLRFKNFVVPVGVSLLLWVFSLVLFNSGFASFALFEYAGLDFAITTGHRAAGSLVAGLPALSVATSAPLLGAGYLLYTRREDRG
jgi:hypothetical protein